MEITRNIIIDLLPLYAADEVSPDTRALVDEYLETDPELARLARRLADNQKPLEIPPPKSENGLLKTYNKVKQRIMLSTLLFAATISIVLLIILVFFLSPS